MMFFLVIRLVENEQEKKKRKDMAAWYSGVACSHNSVANPGSSSQGFFPVCAGIFFPTFLLNSAITIIHAITCSSYV